MQLTLHDLSLELVRLGHRQHYSHTCLYALCVSMGLNGKIHSGQSRARLPLFIVTPKNVNSMMSAKKQQSETTPLIAAHLYSTCVDSNHAIAKKLVRTRRFHTDNHLENSENEEVYVKIQWFLSWR